ncbi:MAG TPA: hypothetical protein VGA06_02295 [Candidatus Paceibacterota bacterium]|jgi:hypothetical protein
MDMLGKLFGSKDIVKLLRLFILNPTDHYDFADVIARTKIDRDIARQELSMLERIGFIKKRLFYKEIEKHLGKRTTMVRKRASGYALNETFTHLSALRELIAGIGMVSERDLTKKLTKAGRLKLVVLSGVFVGDFGSRVDLLVVGDRLRRPVLERVIRDFELEVGREISYAAFSTSDFRYRLSMQDRLLRDTFDFAHSTVLDRLGIDRSALIA